MKKVDLLKGLTEVCDYSLEDALAILENRIVIKKEGANEEADLEKEIATILRDLGVSVKLYGYQYTIEAVKLIIEDKIMVANGQITTYIYPTVAKKFGNTSSNVERGIRHAIRSIWKNMNNPDILKKYFDNTLDPKKAPNVGSFIFAIADYVRRNK